MSTLSHGFKKRHIVITEGVKGINYNYIIDPYLLKCQCSGDRYIPKKPICIHLEYYLCSVIGVKKEFLPILSVPRVRTKVTDNKAMGSTILNDYCVRFLTDSEEDQCIICHASYLPVKSSLDVETLYQCPNCFELLHISCHNKWAATGGSCPRCKYKKDLNGGKVDYEWPSLL